MTANLYIVLPIHNIHRRQECTAITKSTAKNIKAYESRPGCHECATAILHLVLCRQVQSVDFTSYARVAVDFSNKAPRRLSVIPRLLRPCGAFLYRFSGEENPSEERSRHMSLTKLLRIPWYSAANPKQDAQNHLYLANTI